MKKIFSILLTIAVISIMSNSVFCHEGKIDSFGGHCVLQDGYIISYHFHDGRFANYEVVLTNKILISDKDKFMDYVKSLNLEELKKFGTIRIMPPITTATTSQTITPQSTSTPTASQASTVNPTATKSIAVTTIATKVLPKTGQKENTVMLVAGMFILFIGAIGGLILKYKKSF